MADDNRIDTVEVGSVAALTLYGEHDLATHGELAEVMGRLARPGAAIVIDLSATTFIDSSVLRLLIYASDNADTVAVVAPPGSVCARLFTVVGLTARLPVCDSTDQALRHVVRTAPRADQDAVSLLALVDRLLDLAWQSGSETGEILAIARELSVIVGREPLIEDAKIHLAQAQDCTPDEAFQRLVRVSQQRNEKLATLARRLAEAGYLYNRHEAVQTKT